MTELEELSREERLAALFSELDLDGGGTISGTELIDKMASLEENPHRTEVDILIGLLMEGMDLGTFVDTLNAKLPPERHAFDKSMDAFFAVARTVKRSPTSNERLERLFNELDLDGNGDSLFNANNPDPPKQPYSSSPCSLSDVQRPCLYTGTLNGAELIDRMELLNLGPLRTEGAQLSALLGENMDLDSFRTAAFHRLPREEPVLHAMLDRYIMVAQQLKEPLVTDSESDDSSLLSDAFDSGPPFSPAQSLRGRNPTVVEMDRFKYLYGQPNPEHHLAAILIQTNARGCIARRNYAVRKRNMGLKVLSVAPTFTSTLTLETSRGC